MIRTTLALALVLVLGFNSSAQEKKKKTDKELLMGSWTLVTPNTPNTVVELTVTFAKNKELTFTVKANGKEQKAGGTWELKDKKLTTTIQIPNGPEKKGELTIETLDEKHLVTKDSNNGKLEEFNRVVEKKKEEKK